MHKKYFQLLLCLFCLSIQQSIVFATENKTATCANDYNLCSEYLIKKIQDVIEYKSEYKDKSVTLKIVLDDNGNIKSKSITESSGNKILDTYVLAQIEKAAPFSEILSPKNRTHKELQIINIKLEMQD